VTTSIATFRLSGCSHDPHEIKRSSTLEIVELIPAQGTASSPTVRTLTYPISVIKKMGE
jgi:starvation-inducible outer membrane lipoprotein